MSRRNKNLENENPLIARFLGRLRKHFRDDVKELIMNKPCEVELETTKGKWERVKDKTLDYSWFRDMAQLMASATGQDFNTEIPILSFKLPEGHRVQIVHGNSTKDKFLLAIRLFKGTLFDIGDYEIKYEERQQIINAVKEKKNLLISGGTGTGKTSFLNSLINHYVEKDSRIVTIEGVPELIIRNHNNVAPLYYAENQSDDNQFSVSDLLNASLRLRPDRIIMGELRKENCFVFVRAINTGHDGSMATIHANNPENAISAIKENVILNGDAVEGAVSILDNQLHRNIHGVVQLERVVGGKVKGYFESFS